MESASKIYCNIRVSSKINGLFQDFQEALSIAKKNPNVYNALAISLEPHHEELPPFVDVDNDWNYELQPHLWPYKKKHIPKQGSQYQCDISGVLKESVNESVDWKGGDLVFTPGRIAERLLSDFLQKTRVPEDRDYDPFFEENALLGNEASTVSLSGDRAMDINTNGDGSQSPGVKVEDSIVKQECDEEEKNGKTEQTAEVCDGKFSKDTNSTTTSDVSLSLNNSITTSDVSLSLTNSITTSDVSLSLTSSTTTSDVSLSLTSTENQQGPNNKNAKHPKIHKDRLLTMEQMFHRLHNNDYDVESTLDECKKKGEWWSPKKRTHGSWTPLDIAGFELGMRNRYKQFRHILFNSMPLSTKQTLGSLIHYYFDWKKLPRFKAWKEARRARMNTEIIPVTLKSVYLGHTTPLKQEDSFRHLTNPRLRNRPRVDYSYSSANAAALWGQTDPFGGMVVSEEEDEGWSVGSWRGRGRNQSPSRNRSRKRSRNGNSPGKTTTPKEPQDYYFSLPILEGCIYAGVDKEALKNLKRRRLGFGVDENGNLLPMEGMEDLRILSDCEEYISDSWSSGESVNESDEESEEEKEEDGKSSGEFDSFKAIETKTISVTGVNDQAAFSVFGEDVASGGGNGEFVTNEKMKDRCETNNTDTEVTPTSTSPTPGAPSLTTDISDNDEVNSDENGISSAEEVMKMDIDQGDHFVASEV